MDNLSGVIRARRTAAATLCQALRHIRSDYTEAELADRWLQEVRKRSVILPFGWYQPPPHGISVLIGNPRNYERLEYGSLRRRENWPSDDVRATKESVLYPYLSAVDRQSGMIGDFVGTFYAGSNSEIRSWIAEVYNATMQIASFARVGQSLKEVYEYARTIMAELGSTNNTLSVSSGSGFGADIGHTVPGYETCDVPWGQTDVASTEIAREISEKRSFLNATNDAKITNSTAFTIEPQMLQSGLPMASFHVIVAFGEKDRFIIQEFDDIFDLFGMRSWVK